jgi:hypothetical protein
MTNVDLNFPYIVENVDMTFLESDAVSQGIVKVWKVGFDTSDPVKSRGRSQWTVGDANSQLRRELLKYSPGCQGVVDAATPAYNKALNVVHVFGYAGHLRSSSGEMFSLASIRLQQEGHRKIVIMNLEDLANYLEKLVWKNRSAGLQETVQFFKTIDSATVQQICDAGYSIFFATIKPNDLVYQPMGNWVLERPINDERNFGFRCSVLPPVDAASTSPPILGMQTLVRMIQGTDTNQEKYVKQLLNKMTLQSLEPSPTAVTQPVMALENGSPDVAATTGVVADGTEVVLAAIELAGSADSAVAVASATAQSQE